MHKFTRISFIPLLGLILIMGALLPSTAQAKKGKLIVLPLTGPVKLSSSDAEYLLDSMFESSLLALHGQIALIPKQETKRAANLKKGACNETCALSAAEKTGAGLALLLELTSHEGRTIGFVKLLDTSDQSVLSAKRFMTESAQVDVIEQGMQMAVRYVLSAQFLPLSEEDKAILTAKQGQPQSYVSSPSTNSGPKPAPQPTLAADSNSSLYTASPDQPLIAEPVEEEPVIPLTPEQLKRRKKIYLIAGLVMTPVGVGLGLGGMGAFLRAKKDVDHKDALIAQGIGWQNTHAYLNDPTSTNYNPAEYNAKTDEYNTAIAETQSNIDFYNRLGTAFLVSGGILTVGGIVMFVQFFRTKKELALNIDNQYSLVPSVVAGQNGAGAFLTATF